MAKASGVWMLAARTRSLAEGLLTNLRHASAHHGKLFSPRTLAVKMATISSGSAPVPPPLPSLSLNKARTTAGLKFLSNTTSDRIKDVVEQCRAIVCKRNPNCRWLLQNVHLYSELQGDRPVCGLVALIMAAEMTSLSGGWKRPILKKQCTEIEDLLCLAQERGFTKKGEMFSAENLAELSQLFYGLNNSVMSNGLEDCILLLSHLAKGNPVLVAYDVAKNHEPCVAQGHKAHWAVLTGFLCICEDEHFDWNSVEEDLKQPLLYYCHPNVGIPQNLDKDHIYFIGKHGKSRHCGVWPLRALHLSNLNLVELDPLKKAEDHVLPVGGIKGGLSGKVVLLSLPSYCAIVK